MSDLQAVQEVQTQNAIITAKPLKRKYDMRGKYDRSKMKVKPGPKPQYLQRLTRNASAKLIERYESIAALTTIYEYCWAQKMIPELLRMREDALNRAYGRPYQASDPNATAKPNVLEDKRLQIAIKELHVDSTPRLKP